MASLLTTALFSLASVELRHLKPAVRQAVSGPFAGASGDRVGSVGGSAGPPSAVGAAVTASAQFALANHSWKPAPVLSAEELHSFWRDGYLVIRQAIDAARVDIMLQEAERLCLQLLGVQDHCQREQTRFYSGIFRDFLLHGPVGALGEEFIRRGGVRVVQEGIFGHLQKRSWSDFFSLHPHVDHNAKVGIYGGLHSNTSGVSIWLPLHDIDHAAHGGSIALHRGLHNSACLWAFGVREVGRRGKTLRSASAEEVRLCWQEVPKAQVLLSFKRGDLVVWHPNMLHQSQAVVAAAGYHRSARYSWYARLAESEALACMSCCVAADNMACLKRSTRGMMRKGDRLHGPCFPQLYPKLLPSEVQAISEADFSTFDPTPPYCCLWSEDEMPGECLVWR